MQHQVLSSQCVTPARKPDSDLRENECKSRINYSPHWSNRGASVISPTPTTLCPAQCHGTHLPVPCLTLLPPTNIQENPRPESFPLRPPAYYLAKHVPVSSYYQQIILIKHQKKDFLERIAISAIFTPSPLPNHPLPFPQTCT